MKRLEILLLTISLLVLTLTGCGNENKITKQKPLVVMITVASQMGDEGINDAAWAGCEEASDEEGVDIRCLESANKQELASNLISAGNDDAKVAVIVGVPGDEAIKKAAKKYPDTKYLVLESAVSGEDNLGSISFHEEQTGFLAGVAAATTTKTNTVGFLGREGNIVSEKYRSGFTAGVKTVDSDIQVVFRTVAAKDSGSRDKGAAAKAKALHKKGADVIMHSTGAGGKDVIKAAKKEGYMVIGTDVDQSGLDSNSVLCSAVKPVKNVVEKIIGQGVDGNFKENPMEISLSDEGLKLKDNAGNLSENAQKQIEKWQKAIEDGKVTVPSTQKQLAQYQPPEIQ